MSSSTKYEIVTTVTMKFPQITRIISAGVFNLMFITTKSFFYLLLLGLIVLNYHTLLFPQDEIYSRLKTASLTYPPSVESFIKLANYLEKRGLPNEANQQYDLAGRISADKQVLGSQTEEKKLLLISKLDYWQNILKNKPDYRDGYLQMALIFKELGLNDKANEAYQKAKNFDPFF